MLLGDIVWDGFVFYLEIREVFVGIGKFYYMVCGNYDINLWVLDLVFSWEIF